MLRSALSSRRVTRAALAAVAATAVAVPLAVTTGSAGAAPTPTTPARAGSTAALTARLDQAFPSTAQRPTIVLVHGAWADASSWDGVVRILQAAGFTVRAVANPLENLTTDAQSVAAFLRTIPGPVVLVGHSYGGAVITNAAAEVHNVKALVYVDPVEPDKGEANISLVGAGSALSQHPAAQLEDFVPEAGGAPAQQSFLKEDAYVRYFANDLPVQQAEALWAEQRGAANAAFQTPTKYVAWKTIPSWAFISTGDRIISPTSMLSMAHRAHSQVTLFHGGSHVSLISNPLAVASTISSAILSLR